MNLRYLLIPFLSLFILISCEQKKDDVQSDNSAEITEMENKYKAFYNDLTAKLAKAETDMALSYFEASINSNEENWKKQSEFEQIQNKLLSDKSYFNQLKEFKESGLIKDELLSRSLDVLYTELLGNQIDTVLLDEISNAQSKIELKYSNFRAKIGNKSYDDNQVEDILKNSTDQKLLENIWKAHKEIGPLVADDIIQLVKMRNNSAKTLGFKNYHEMSLKLSEEDPEEISKLFDELDDLTRDAFIELKSDIDDYLAKRNGISKDKLMPWHYQNRYFQEAPKIYNVDHDVFYKNKDVVKLTEDYYSSLGLPINNLVAKSDLYPKANKNQHAYCINIDRNKRDIRVLGNVSNNASWMETMLHEFGHALYENHYSDDLPWGLKTPAHIFTTEGIAMLFGRFAINPNWMQDNLNISNEEKDKIAEDSHKMQRLQQLVFSRWAQVMYRFEKSMYENPDQDLNKLWWDIVEKYQMIKKPEGRNMPDWASKIHIATSPCYYHNYLMGELFASQFYNTICEKALKVSTDTNPSFYGRTEAGDFLKEFVFGVGNRYFWNDMIEKATGEKLTAKYYAKQFVH